MLPLLQNARNQRHMRVVTRPLYTSLAGRDIHVFEYRDSTTGKYSNCWYLTYIHRDPYCGTVLTLYNSTMNSDKAPVHDQVGVKETAARDGINVVAHALGATVGLGGSE